MNKKIILSICAIITIIFITVGVTYAYLVSSADVTGRIEGNVETFGANLTLAEVYKASKLVPLSNDLIDEAISKTSNKCIDKNNYQVCSLFTLTLTNSAEPVELNGYVRTESSTYITNNLKYQIFDSNYNAVSDVMTISNTANSMVYFDKNTSRLNFNLSTTNQVYYLAVWLSETGSSQSDDYSKTFSGKVGFESIVGDTIEASFDT